MADDDKLAEVMDKIETFYFGDGEDSGEAVFNSFAAKHADLFDTGCDALEDENKLEYILILNFVADTPRSMRSSRLSSIPKSRVISIFITIPSDLVRQCDISVERFFEIVKKKSEEGDSEAKMFVAIMLSVSDYANFVEMMRAFKKEHA